MNLRPPGYEPDELPDCSTPRQYKIKSGRRRIRTFEAIATDLQSAPFGRSGIHPHKKKADDRTRTDNLLITSQLLCQLSHIGINVNDSDGNRTRVTAVKGRCLDRLTKEPYMLNTFRCFNSPCWTRTNDNSVNSRVLYRLS